MVEVVDMVQVVMVAVAVDILVEEHLPLPLRIPEVEEEVLSIAVQIKLIPPASEQVMVK